jgi:hypothetical protein
MKGVAIARPLLPLLDVMVVKEGVLLVVGDAFRDPLHADVLCILERSWERSRDPQNQVE